MDWEGLGKTEWLLANIILEITVNIREGGGNDKNA